jgi:hypothetical protein
MSYYGNNGFGAGQTIGASYQQPDAAIDLRHQRHADCVVEELLKKERQGENFLTGASLPPSLDFTFNHETMSRLRFGFPGFLI